MNIYRVKKEYTRSSDNPIKLKKGDKVICTEESDSTGDWANWLYCKSKDNEGWVPKQIVNLDNNTIMEDYHAIEFNLFINDILISEKQMNGWIWGHKKADTKLCAWAPLNHLEFQSLEETPEK